MDDFEYIRGCDRLVAIDMETTGRKMMTPDEARRAPKGLRIPGVVIEIGCVELLRDGDGWRKGRTWETKVNPDAPIRPDSVAVHGIKQADLAAAPRFREVVGTLRELVGDSTMVAHAYLNEKRFLDYEFARAGLIAWGEEAYRDGRYLCTQELYAGMFPGAPKSLDAACDRLWVDRKDRFALHGALLDADLTADALLEMVRRHEAGPEPEPTRSYSLG